MWVSHGIHAHVGKGKDLIGLTVTAVRQEKSADTVGAVLALPGSKWGQTKG